MDDVMKAIMMDPAPIGLIRLCPTAAETWRVLVEFSGRDRRRIKREVRKALAKLPKPHFGGIDRNTNIWWRNAA